MRYEVQTEIIGQWLTIRNFTEWSIAHDYLMNRRKEFPAGYHRLVATRDDGSRFEPQVKSEGVTS